MRSACNVFVTHCRENAQQTTKTCHVASRFHTFCKVCVCLGEPLVTLFWPWYIFSSLWLRDCWPQPKIVPHVILFPRYHDASTQNKHVHTCSHVRAYTVHVHAEVHACLQYMYVHIHAKYDNNTRKSYNSEKNWLNFSNNLSFRV